MKSGKLTETLKYPPVIKRGNGQFPIDDIINGGFDGKINENQLQTGNFQVHI